MIRPNVRGLSVPEGDHADQMPERLSLIGRSLSDSEAALADPALR
jgi:hypothetical protein